MARHRAREFALQGVYQWLVAGGEPWDIIRDLREDDEYAAADAAFVERLVGGVISDADELSDWMQPFLDRPVNAVSPVERAILMLAAFELRTAPEAEFGAPYRVVINEAVELAKVFGGTDGHKYVNGVVDKLAGTVRAEERAAQPGRQDR
jgi:N utilization substance protein B